jgi:hypothetical protein
MQTAQTYSLEKLSLNSNSKSLHLKPYSFYTYSTLYICNLADAKNLIGIIATLETIY